MPTRKLSTTLLAITLNHDLYSPIFNYVFFSFRTILNSLIVGESMRPLTDLLSISREKLAFVVDATSAPVASITPISAWIGFEIGLIQAELDKTKKVKILTLS